jgi:long-chain acyl-CoA synthetase
MGYYKDKERTAEALDADGWLHTGDIGIWDSNQNLRIVDRKKNIFKLSQGEYVAAEKIEIVMAKSTFVASVWVYGDSLRSCLVAVCVPSADNLKNWAKGGAKEKLSFEELCNDAEVKKVVLDDIVKTCKAARLNNIEIIKNIHLESKPWTPDDVLTPTLKMKRHDAKLKYQSVINAMYKEVDGK